MFGKENPPNAVTFFPFLINWTLTHFLIAEFGCFASTPTFSSTIPLACEEPPKGEDLNAVPRSRFLNPLSAHRLSRLWFRSFRAALSPLGFPLRFPNVPDQHHVPFFASLTIVFFIFFFNSLLLFFESCRYALSHFEISSRWWLYSGKSTLGSLTARIISCVQDQQSILLAWA